MAKRKQQQDAADLDSKVIKLEESGKSEETNFIELEQSSKRETTLPSLWTLPEEIRAYIFRLVCSRGHQEEGAESSVEGKDAAARSFYGWRVDLDIKTVCSLTLVSRDFNAYFTPLLYAHVRLSKPSSLTQFHASLLSRPSNGLLVKSMHLGPLNDLHENYWPVTWVSYDDETSLQSDEDEDDRTTVLFRSGLTEKEALLSPQWCEGDQDFAYLEEAEEAGEQAANNALREAFRKIGINPNEGSSHDQDGKLIGIIEGTRRIYDAQGALDLYLCHLRRIEDAAAATGKEVEEYPHLVLEGFDTSKDPPATPNNSHATHEERGGATSYANHPLPTDASKQNNVVVVTRQQIKAHLGRRGAHTDHFDHPLVFAQENLRELATDVWGKVIVDRKQVKDWEYIAEDRGKPRSYGPSFPRWRDGVPALGRFVLRLTPHVKNLSLTGLFHDCLEGRRLPALARLRFLSVGPLTRHTHAAICITEGSKLPAVEKLRICGNFPGIGAALLIGGQAEGLQSLREAYWDFGHTDSSSVGGGGEEFLWRMLNIMRGAAEMTELYAPIPDDQPSCRYVEARLHPDFVTAMLSKAGTPEIRAALSDGLHASDALRSLRILESRASSESSPWRSSSQKFDVLRQESLEWWKACAVEVERAEGQSEGP